MQNSYIYKDIQDRECEAWVHLCEYIDELAKSEKTEFNPRKALGKHFLKIHTLPSTIGKLKKVTHINLYGSQLNRIPPEIGLMDSLQEFDVYTSYKLFWFPYEITECKNLESSRISTRVLYGNYKNRKPFPSLFTNPVHFNERTKCSVCKKEETGDKFEQLWIQSHVGTDTLPLLANVCSTKCKNELITPPKHYVPVAHKGGNSINQPKTFSEIVEEANKNGRYYGLIDLGDKNEPLKVEPVKQ